MPKASQPVILTPGVCEGSQQPPDKQRRKLCRPHSWPRRCTYPGAGLAPQGLCTGWAHHARKESVMS